MVQSSRAPSVVFDDPLVPQTSDRRTGHRCAAILMQRELTWFDPLLLAGVPYQPKQAGVNSLDVEEAFQRPRVFLDTLEGPYGPERSVRDD